MHNVPPHVFGRRFRRPTCGLAMEWYVEAVDQAGRRHTGRKAIRTSSGRPPFRRANKTSICSRRSSTPGGHPRCPAVSIVQGSERREVLSENFFATIAKAQVVPRRCVPARRLPTKRSKARTEVLRRTFNVRIPLLVTGEWPWPGLIIGCCIAKLAWRRCWTYWALSRCNAVAARSGDLDPLHPTAPPREAGRFLQT